MKIEETLLHMTRYALEGKFEDALMLAKMTCRRAVREGRTELAQGLRELLRQHPSLRGILRSEP